MEHLPCAVQDMIYLLFNPPRISHVSSAWCWHEDHMYIVWKVAKMDVLFYTPDCKWEVTAACISKGSKMSSRSNERALNGLFTGTQWCRINRSCYFKRGRPKLLFTFKREKSLSSFFLYETYPVLLKQHDNIVHLIVYSCSSLSVNILLNIIMETILFA